MGSAILKLGDSYLIWSSVVDAPVTWGMTRIELHDYIRREYGEAGLRELPARLARVDAKGTSAFRETPEELISCNRAGAGETRLTLEQIVDFYVTRQGRGARPVGVRDPDDDVDEVSS